MIQSLVFLFFFASLVCYSSAQTYLITNYHNNLRLDSHASADPNSTQYDPDHWRPFISSPLNPVPSAHLWLLIASSQNYYLIQSVETGLCLDGNITVPQYNLTFPTPFLGTCKPNAHSQQWVLIGTLPLVYIRNVQTGLLLNGDTAIANYNPLHPNAFSSNPMYEYPVWNVTLYPHYGITLVCDTKVANITSGSKIRYCEYGIVLPSPNTIYYDPQSASIIVDGIRTKINAEPGSGITTPTEALGYLLFELPQHSPAGEWTVYMSIETASPDLLYDAYAYLYTVA